MIRWMCHFSPSNRDFYDLLRERFYLTQITELMRHGRLRWFGHIVRRNEDNCLRQVQNLVVQGDPVPGRTPNF